MVILSPSACAITSSVSFLALLLLLPACVYSHGLGFHAVDGEPGPVPILPDITGPFEAEVDFIFHQNVTDLYFQRLFDFCDGGNNIVAIGQLGYDAILMLEVVTTSGSSYVYSPTGWTIPEDVPTTVRAGVEPDGTLWIQVEGEPIVWGNVMFDVEELSAPKNTKLIGESCIPGDSDMAGAVLGIRITPHGQPRIGVEQNRFRNLPSQILGPFTMSFWARFENLLDSPFQILFDLSNGVGTNNIFMRHHSGTSAMQFCILIDGQYPCAYMNGGVVEGEVAFWHAGVTPNGTMWIEKNGDKTGYQYIEYPEEHPVGWNNEIRTKMQFGHGDYPEDHTLDGFIIGFQVDGIAMS